MSERDRVLQAAREADATMNDPLPEDAPAVRPNKTVPVSVRLAPAMVADIEELAQRLDIPASTLLRTWIQQGIAAHHETNVAAALDQLAADLQRLRQIVA